ncbi:hypothetical protein PNI0164_00808 [Streptococcus pneumoniae PNI0164]|nr:hypothetical protein PNI0164_00808 [Streptococcus pneumoniae PNI0164]
MENNTLRKSLQTTSASSTTSKRVLKQLEAGFLVCFLIFIEYKQKELSGSFYFIDFLRLS